MIKFVIIIKLTEKISFNFSYNSKSTFGHLMHYITQLCHTKIYPCFIFYYNDLKININEKITILHNYLKEGILSSGKIDLSTECNKCICRKIFVKYSSKPKIEQFWRTL